ncbi:hypothetical protein SAMN04488118_1162 [Epibacterium ulvae]|uniref:Uncharacterized protein n=1 Tax=Epibacterium ulvae TaxID=1156985 RepID=A0A1G5QUN0_9RHOB|nr:hypothetical protein SAMN04488118_1033 [Epibacterium ulvae]SCZ64789.1 hypothetical protein SAMN04488118_105322 [Epibacterium ulvae]SCZ71741.1 hypothetical protein SAMN04488118_112113 [Epibacterium ulvae]SCZ73012.1 hypothetical protein SAMN04488118_1162 [Epibacterium ulvae]
MTGKRSERSISWMNTAGNAPLSADLALPNRLPGNGSIRVKRQLNSTEVIDALTDLFILRGVPAFSRSDNGPLAIVARTNGAQAGFIAQAVRDWIAAVGAKTAYIEPVTRLDLLRFSVAPSARLGDFLLESDWASPSQC